MYFLTLVNFFVDFMHMNIFLSHVDSTTVVCHSERRVHVTCFMRRYKEGDATACSKAVIIRQTYDK